MNKKKINMKDELFSAPEDRLSQLYHEDTRMDYLNQKGGIKKVQKIMIVLFMII